jgi:hypothetical protein
MPQRQNKRKVVTTELQGEDSFVVVTLPKVSEIEDVIKIMGDDLESFKCGSQIIADHILEWNWVDDDGESLPLPSGDAEIVGLLTTEEYKALLNMLLGDKTEKKK